MPPRSRPALALLLAVAAARPAQRRRDPAAYAGEEVVFVGCFPELPPERGEHDLPGWQQAVVQPRTGVAGCAARCSHSPYFALQAGICQCASSFGSTPNAVRPTLVPAVK